MITKSAEKLSYKFQQCLLNAIDIVCLSGATGITLCVQHFFQLELSHLVSTEENLHKISTVMFLTKLWTSPQWSIVEKRQLRGKGFHLHLLYLPTSSMIMSFKWWPKERDPKWSKSVFSIDLLGSDTTLLCNNYACHYQMDFKWLLTCCLSMFTA